MKTFGVVGLGRMGGGLAFQALGKGYTVVGMDTHAPNDELVKAGIVATTTPEDFLSKLPTPRVVFLYVPAGDAIDQLSATLAPHLSPGDIIVDGGNSYWGDSIRRNRAWEAKGIHFVDLGTSGGVTGARNGACFMLGGVPAAKAVLTPILMDLCIAGGFVDAGGPGTGHFTKLVHNGIEFGMLQAIGEGMELMQNFHEPLPLVDVLSCWRNGSVIRSWLIDLMHEGMVKGDPTLAAVPAYIEDTGEVNWLVGDAMEMEVPIPVIAQSVMQLFAARDKEKTSVKAIAMMRHGFGGHPYGESDFIKNERKTSKVGDIYRPESEDAPAKG